MEGERDHLDDDGPVVGSPLPADLYVDLALDVHEDQATCRDTKYIIMTSVLPEILYRITLLDIFSNI